MYLMRSRKSARISEATGLNKARETVPFPLIQTKLVNEP